MLGCGPMGGAFAQQCGDTPTIRERIKAFCTAYHVPEVSYWEGAGYARCPCPSLSAGSAPYEPEAQRAIREQYVHKLSLQDNAISFTFRAGDEAPGFPLKVDSVRIGQSTSDSLIYVKPLPDCFREDIVLEILQRTIGAPKLRYAKGMMFQVNIKSLREPFMSYTTSPEQSDGIDVRWHLITIPRELLWHPSMTYELLAFMLLHEVGHAVDDHAPAMEDASEAMADHWAAHVAIPHIFGVAQAEQLRIRIAGQFREYCASVYTPETYQDPSATTGLLNSYPRLSCRVRSILDPFWMDREAIGSSSYPDSCWCQTEEARCGPSANLNPSNWRVGSCINTLNCIKYNGTTMCKPLDLQYVPAKVAPHIDYLFSECQACPDLCESAASKSPAPCAARKDTARTRRRLQRAWKRVSVLR